jgi:hypothetical protein
MLKVSAFLGSMFLVTVALSSQAGAVNYNNAAAVNYAQTYAITDNPVYPAFSDDCTDFVSQALRAGGVPLVFDDLAYNEPNIWFVLNTTDSQYITFNIADGRESSTTATVAPQLRTYLDTYGYGIPDGSFSYSSGHAAPSEPSPYIVPGDVFFYNWTGTAASGISHSSFDAIESGTDSYGYIGSLADEHTTNRSDVFWTLKPVNSNWQTTTIWYSHVLA